MSDITFYNMQYGAHQGTAVLPKANLLQTNGWVIAAWNHDVKPSTIFGFFMNPVDLGGGIMKLYNIIQELMSISDFLNPVEEEVIGTSGDLQVRTSIFPLRTPTYYRSQGRILCRAEMKRRISFTEALQA